MNFFSPSRAGRHICPGMNEISQVPYKGRLYVQGVSDYARLLVAKPFQREEVAFSSSNWIGNSKFDPFRRHDRAFRLFTASRLSLRV
jgi:hypothetical protein